MKKRISTPVSTIEDREGLEHALGQYAKLVLEAEALEVELAEKTRAAREDYERRAAVLAKQTKRLFGDIKDYAAVHRDEFPNGNKSMEMLHGTIGYRTGNPTVKTPAGIEERDVVEDLKGAGLAEYVRVREELNREKIADAVKDDAVRQSLEAHGVKVVQKESFFVVIKREQAQKEA